MFLKDWQLTPVKNTKKVELICNNCGNKTKHEVFREPYGPAVGVVFAKKPWLSLNHYWLVCPICRNKTKQIKKEQLNALKKC